MASCRALSGKDRGSKVRPALGQDGGQQGAGSKTPQREHDERGTSELSRGGQAREHLLKRGERGQQMGQSKALELLLLSFMGQGAPSETRTRQVAVVLALPLESASLPSTPLPSRWLPHRLPSAYRRCPFAKPS